jgi:hypothetical protein
MTAPECHWGATPSVKCMPAKAMSDRADIASWLPAAGFDAGITAHTLVGRIAAAGLGRTCPMAVPKANASSALKAISSMPSGSARYRRNAPS